MLKKKMNVYVTDYPSEYWPIKAIFRYEKETYNLVFESITELKQYFRCRFYPTIINIKDRRETIHE